MGARCGKQSLASSPEIYTSGLTPSAAAPTEAPAPALKESPVSVSLSRASTDIGLTKGGSSSSIDPSEDYDLDVGVIGTGAFGTVRRGIRKHTSREQAIKSVEKKNAYINELLRNESSVLASMDHPNVVRLHGVYEDSTHVHFVMEFLGGGELLDRVGSIGKFTERDAAICMQQMLSAAYYLHSRHLAHRDHKPENYLFTSQAAVEDNTLKLIDFGLACSCPPGTVLEARVGTTSYMSPQCLKGRYNRQTDCWSLGVILYLLLAGHLPFEGSSREAVKASILAGAWSFRHESWTDISAEAKDLVTNLLKMSPRSRLTAEQAVNHTWILNKVPQKSPRHTALALGESLKQFQHKTSCRKGAMKMVAGYLRDDVLSDLRDQFRYLDKNGDGVLSRSEMDAWLGDLGMSEAEAEHVLDYIDDNHDGTIEYTEFLAAALDQAKYKTEDVMREVFKTLDKDGDGEVSVEEFREHIHHTDHLQWLHLDISDNDMEAMRPMTWENFKRCMLKDGDQLEVDA